MKTWRSDGCGDVAPSGLGLSPRIGVMDVWGSRWLSFCPWVPGLSFPPGGGEWKVDCGPPPALSLLPCPQSVGWSGCSQILTLLAVPVPVSWEDPPMVRVGVGVRLGVMRSGFLIVSESRTSSADRWAWGSAAVSWPWLQRHTLALLRPTLQNPSPGANWHHLKCLCGTERRTEGGAPRGLGD